MEKVPSHQNHISSSYSSFCQFKSLTAAATVHIFLTSTLIMVSLAPVLGDAESGSGLMPIKRFIRVFFPERPGPTIMPWEIVWSIVPLFLANSFLHGTNKAIVNFNHIFRVHTKVKISPKTSELRDNT